MDRVVTKSNYNKKVHMGFYRFHMFHKSYSIYLVMLLGALVIYLAVKNSSLDEGSINSTIFVWVLAAFTILFTPAIMFGRIATITKNEAKERGDSVEILEFTKDKMMRRIEGAGNKVVIGWYNIDSIYEKKDAVYIYVSNDQGVVFSKDKIIEGDIETFRKLAKNNMKPNKRGKVPFKIKYKEQKND